MHSNVTILKDRLILADGRLVVEPEVVPQLFIKGFIPSEILVTELNDDLLKFNLRSDIEINVVNEDDFNIIPEVKWLIPQDYINIDLNQYFKQKLIEKNPINFDIAEVRVENELNEVYKRQFDNGIKTIIYVVDIFKKHNQIWGVGRGSSCASYLLYLIGLHCVDPIKYNIPFTEFFHD